nr:PP1ab [Porcine reproductive and respiratory syndrome virus]
MSGTFSRCMCTPAARVFWNAGQVYCTRCLSARSLLPPELQDTDLAAIGLFYRPKDKLHWKVPIGIPQVECTPSGCCWLSAIFVLARMTSGNHNFMQRLVKVAEVLYRDGCLASQHLRELQVYDRGCSWYPITGPVPGMGLFANSMHVSDQPFPGATHVLTNSPLPQQARRQPFCPFEEAHSDVYKWREFVVFADSSSNGRSRLMWTPGSGDSANFEALPPELERRVEILIRSFPAYHPIDLSDWELTETSEQGFSFGTSHSCGYLAQNPYGFDSKCWLSCFFDLPATVWRREEYLADTYGYQTKWGVHGKYLQRRLQINGLRAVVDPDGPIHVEALSCPQSWIRHLTLNDDVTPGFVRLMSLRIVSNTEPTTLPVFRFEAHKWYGAAGKRARAKRAAKSGKDLAAPTKGPQPITTYEVITYSPPTDGSCGWHVLAAIVNRMMHADFTSPLATYNRPEDDWASDYDLAQAIQCLNLPAAIVRNRACPNAKYLVKLNGVHWEVEVRSGMPPCSLSRECVVGVCSEDCAASPYPENGLHRRALEALASAYRLPSDCVSSGINDFLTDPPQESWTLDKMLTSPSPEQSGFSSLYKLLLEVVPQKCGATEGAFIYAVESMLKDCPSPEQAMALLTKIKVPSSKAPSVSLDECFPAGVSIDFESSSRGGPKGSSAAAIPCSPGAKGFEETAPEKVPKKGREAARPPLFEGKRAGPSGNDFAVKSAHDSAPVLAGPAGLTGEDSPNSSSVSEGVSNDREDGPLDLSRPSLVAAAASVKEQTPDTPGPGTDACSAAVQGLASVRPAPRLVERCRTEPGNGDSPLDLSNAPIPDQPLDLSLAAWPVKATASDPGWVHGRREPVFVKPRGAFSDGDSVLQFGGLSESSSVVEFDRTKDAPAVDAPADLTTSNEALSAVDPFDFAEPERPRFSAQALIDRGGPLAEVHVKIKNRVYEQCLQACEPSSRATPATKDWLNKMWDRVDMKTWRCTSQFQAGRILASLKFLPDMIQDTPPPVPKKNRASSNASLKQLVEQWDRKLSITPTSESVELALDQTTPPIVGAQQEDALLPDGPFHAPNPPGRGRIGGSWRGSMLSVARRAGSVSQRLMTWVFEIVSHLPAFALTLFSPRGSMATGDWLFAGVVLLALLLCRFYPVFGCLPLLGVFSGSVRRVRLGVFGSWMAFAVFLFSTPPNPVGSSCNHDSPECHAELLALEQCQLWEPVRGLVVGPSGLLCAILGKLLGGSRYLWHVLLRLCMLADLSLSLVYVVSQGRCHKCWGKCIRMAPAEVALNVFPFSRATRSSLVSLCDRFQAPKGVDPVHLATGWRGCWRGESPIHQPHQKPIAYANLDEKKISAQTVVAVPYDPSQAIKCLKVLQAGGAIVDLPTPEVVRVSEIPFSAPFFPNVPVNPDCRVVVDSDTFVAAVRCGYSTAQLVLGQGNFAKLNQSPFRNSTSTKTTGGASYTLAVTQVSIWTLVHFILGLWLTSPQVCGRGTSDPWCSNPFSYPTYGPGVVCSSRLCVSADGVTLPLFSAVAQFSGREVGIFILVLVSLGALAHRLALKADMLMVFLAFCAYAWPLSSWLICLFPILLRWVTLHPLTMLWVHSFLVFCLPAAGVLSLVITGLLWAVGRFTQVAGIITPYDIHQYTSGPRGAAAIATAPEGTYMAAVRRAALTGRTLIFTPSAVGSLLEGAFRTHKPCLNTVNVVGSSLGSGGVFTIDGEKIVVTAAHVLNGDTARVTGDTYNRMHVFKTNGDYAWSRADNWQGVAPAVKVVKGYRGRAYWQTSTGVEPGIIGEGFAFCFTNCGDSGSPVISESGDLIGIHTGSNKLGSGLVTTPNGETCTIKETKLSDLSKYFAGPGVPLGDIKLSPAIIPDVTSIPSDLASLLASVPVMEGGLSTVQLLCVFFLLWRMMGHAWTPIVAVGFFLLNEILPAVLVRAVFSFALFVLAWATPWSAQVLVIRLLTAALNRNRLSLTFYALGGVVGLAAEVGTFAGRLSELSQALSTYCFLPRVLAMTSCVPTIVIGGLHALGVILWLFKYRSLHNMLVGDGHFSKAFFLRYFAEGNLRKGVSQSCGMNNESLTAALACKLSQADLDFLSSLTSFKCFVSASNMKNAAGQYIEAAYAKALRQELASLVQIDKMKGVLSKLEAFAETATPSLDVGDVIVLLGQHPHGSILDINVGTERRTVSVQETRSLGGSKFSVCTVVSNTPVDALAGIPLQTPTPLFENGPRHRGEEDDLRVERSKKHCVSLGFHNINGKFYCKIWDKSTGDTFYTDDPRYTQDYAFQDKSADHRDRNYEGMQTAPQQGFDPQSETPVGTVVIGGVTYNRYLTKGKEVLVPKPDNCLEAAKLSIEQALAGMGQTCDLTAVEVEKLKRIINQLQGMTTGQALNCLAASGLTRCGRGGLVVTETAVKIVKYHSRTFTLGPLDLKVTSESEVKKSTEQGHAVVANLCSGVVLMRPHPPSLVDVLLKPGLDTTPGIQPGHGAGNMGVDGSIWDFETAPTKAELELSRQIIQACEVRRGDAPNLQLPYKLYPVRGDPERHKGCLINTRFGNLSYKTPQDTESAIHAACCLQPNGVPVSDGRSTLGTTLQHGFELYVPTVPYSVMEYLDSRSDTPSMYTKHGTSKAAAEDLQKYDLSTQGFVLPGVLRLVRRFIFGHIGKSPPLFLPSTYPAKNSMAGVNGQRFPTKDVQSIPEIDEMCARAVKENWQTVTPCTLKKQYCSRPKTRTILGTNNFIALAHRSALSGVTQAFMKKAWKSPIALGKNKFKELHCTVAGRCLEADLASCDRSTPAIVRWFTANLLFELAGCEEYLPSYVLNCCHDLVATQDGAFTKRGGLSSGDPVTSVSNTVYSLIIYAQHMVLSALKMGHEAGLKFLDEQLKFEDLLEIQPMLVYSDDLVLYAEKPTFPNYHWWVEHLDLMLGFKTDPKKTVITDKPSFLGCRIEAGRQLVPNRDRILAALAYHMKAQNASEYYASAAAILMDSCACIDHDPEWYEDLICGIARCARQDGYSFPGPSFFLSMWEKLKSHNEGKKFRHCGICDAKADHASACGLDLCSFHSHFHQHCPVTLNCGHHAGSKECPQCQSPVGAGKSPLDAVLKQIPYKPPRTVIMNVNNKTTTLDPGRYQSRRGLVAVKRGIAGNEVDLADGDYQVVPLLPTCKDINMVKVAINVLLSKFIVGPPGSGKTTWLLSQVQGDDVIYTPTHQTMFDIVNALKVCRYSIPGASGLPFPPPARSGPWVRLIASGHIPGRTSYLDEAGYCNHLDILRLLSKTPLVCLGDLQQLHPVGFDSYCYVFDQMPHKQLTTIYRFGPNICAAIQPCYRERLESKARNTRVVFTTRPVDFGQVLTPYHKDRIGSAITIDSSQGATFDVVTLHLPSPMSLNKSRALVAITRARYGLFIYDPHDQLQEFFNLIPERTDCNLVFNRGDELVVLNADNVVTTVAKALEAGPSRFQVSDPRCKSLLAACSVSLEGSCMPLPQVAHNLGFYFSPDSPAFAPLPKELAPHWPVVTHQNCKAWPDRLVASMRPIDAHYSKPMVGAGYVVGPSTFLGTPGVVSYYLTLYVKGEPQALPETLVSTGRIATDCREYLDAAEEEAAKELPHAFIGDVKGTTVGGCHHITSKYLPRYLPKDSVAVVGVSSPGRAAKAVCTLTDVYLPELRPYLQPETASKCWKLKLDFRDVRLMVWKGSTAYFQLEGLTWSALPDYARFIQLPKEAVVYIDPCIGPATANRKVVRTTDWRADLAVTPYDYGAPNILTTAWFEDLGPQWKILGLQPFKRTLVFENTEDWAILARRMNDGKDYTDYNWDCVRQRPHAIHGRARDHTYHFAPGTELRVELGKPRLQPEQVP